jgi:hypothetical protein
MQVRDGIATWRSPGPRGASDATSSSRFSMGR